MAGKKPVHKGPSGLQQFGGHLMTALLIFLLITGAYSFIVGERRAREEVPLSQVAQDIIAGRVEEITVRGDALAVRYADDTEKQSKKEFESSLSETLSAYGVTPQVLVPVVVRIENQSGFSFWFLNLLPIIIPLVIVLFFFWFLSRQVRSSGMQAFTFGQSKARVVDPGDKKQKVTFKDVAGNEEAKEELVEIVDFLKNPKKFLDIGARIPKGVLLMGASGTGKTLLARAVAGEAGVPFLYLSGSEFVELFVGVGASRVRSLFQMAKKSSPAIIFIDEIDAVGRHRGSGMGGGNDEREQTLNQILVEMDGFEPNEKLIVMAATNRPDVLDPALLRPGRFDRRVVIDLPDLKDRRAILTVHAANKSLGEDVGLEVIAERTPGFSGADLANLINEAAILAARENRKQITQYDLIRSIEKVMLGPERKSHIFSDHEKEIVAYHETGHALVASALEYADPVHKVTIISRGRAGGYTLKLPLEERRLKSRKEFLDDIASLLGGFAAEKMVYGDITTGPSNDISVATAIARDMIMKYGMSDKVGPVSFDETTLSPYFGRGALSEKNYSEEYAARIDAEVKAIMERGFERAAAILKKHEDALHAIAKKLKEVETLERKEFDNQLILHGIEPKRKKTGEPVV